MKRTNLSDYEAITAVVQKYIDGCNEGKSAVMKPAFDNGAVMYGTKADGTVEAKGSMKTFMQSWTASAPIKTGTHASMCLTRPKTPLWFVSSLKTGMA